MIQDIAPHQYHNEYKPVPPTKDSYLLYFSGREALIRGGKEEFSFATFADYPELPLELSEKVIYLFAIDEHHFYLARELENPVREDLHMVSSRFFREGAPQWLAFAGITGHQLWDWYENRRFCGHCGKPMVHSVKERAMVCPECKITEYPKICPAVIVGIIHNDKLLMSKYAGRDNITYYALLAGFTEIGETIEETVQREVYEEVGLHVKNLRYYKSQPWSFSGTLLMGFYADLDGDDAITLDEEELSTAGWFTREDAPAQPLNISLTGEMIRRFKEGKA